MFFSSQSSPYDEVVEKATAETLLEENWALMMDISDKVSMEGQKGCKAVMLSIKKRLNNRDPHVVIYALSLLDCLWKNAGVEFRRTVSSKDFIPELRDKSTASTNAVAAKACSLIKEWSQTECAKDPSLALIPTLYKELKDQGLFFENQEPRKSKVAYSNDPNVVSSAEEEAQIALAIAASMNDVSIKNTKSSAAAAAPTGYYPSLSSSSFNQQPTNGSRSSPPPPTPSQPSYREVKALYDFEAAEDNELTMRAGDSITVVDESDPNWWKGQSHRGVGLFPSSFVSGNAADINGKNFNADGISNTPIEEPPVQIDEEALKKCMQLLEECDPTGETPDPPALAYFENMAMQMSPMIDRMLANTDRLLNMLATVDIAMRDVLASYDQAVQQVQIPQMPQMMQKFPQQQQQAPQYFVHPQQQHGPASSNGNQPAAMNPQQMMPQPYFAHQHQQQASIASNQGSSTASRTTPPQPLGAPSYFVHPQQQPQQQESAVSNGIQGTVGSRNTPPQSMAPQPFFVHPQQQQPPIASNGNQPAAVTPQPMMPQPYFSHPQHEPQQGSIASNEGATGSRATPQPMVTQPYFVHPQPQQQQQGSIVSTGGASNGSRTITPQPMVAQPYFVHPQQQQQEPAMSNGNQDAVGSRTATPQPMVSQPNVVVHPQQQQQDSIAPNGNQPAAVTPQPMVAQPYFVHPQQQQQPQGPTVSNGNAPESEAPPTVNEEPFLLF